jgi:hypothetical protein
VLGVGLKVSHPPASARFTPRAHDTERRRRSSSARRRSITGSGASSPRRSPPERRSASPIAAAPGFTSQTVHRVPVASTKVRIICV